MKKKKFSNRPNASYKVDNKLVWESRSVAVNCIIMVEMEGIKDPYVLVSKRGPNAADYHGKMNLIAGYLDWDETATEAVYREGWEETGIWIPELLETMEIKKFDLASPWNVVTSPSENRQNVSLRYGAIFKTDKSELPSLSLENNEVPGEVEEAMWLPLSHVPNHEWAFNHDKLIEEYATNNGYFYKNYKNNSKK